MIGVTVVAIVLSSISTWRYLSLARIEWLAPSSAAARRLIQKPVLIRLDDGFEATYTTRFRPVDELLEATVEEQRSGRATWSGVTTHHSLHTIIVRSGEKADVEETLSGFEKIDVPAPGWFVIRGVVEDRKGQPVGGATVHLHGPSPFSHFIQSRGDGTFTFPLQVPPGRGYIIRVSHGSNKSMNTAPFALTNDNRELVARIRVK